MNICRYFYLGMKAIFTYFLLGLYTVITIIPKYFILGIKYLFFTKKENRKKEQVKIPIIMISLTLLVYFSCIFIISRWTVQKLKLEYLAKNIIETTKVVEIEEQKIEKEEEPPQVAETASPPEKTYYPNDYWKYKDINYIDVDLTSLIKQNADTVAWININNTNVNYPVVQGSDNSYYLYHTFNKSSNNNGWIFGDYRNNWKEFKDNTIIYGHNLTNRAMFGSLSWTLKPDWYKNSANQDIKISTTTANTVWKIFSIYTVEVETYYLRTLFANEQDYQDFINKMLSRSIYNFGVEVTTNDKILTLSTCDDAGTKRLVIQAKMIKIDYK